MKKIQFNIDEIQEKILQNLKTIQKKHYPYEKPITYNEIFFRGLIELEQDYKHRTGKNEQTIHYP